MSEQAIVPIKKEEPPIIESTATPEVQAAAEKLGWIPASRFRGDPERFVDAELYIERGEIVLPIVKDQNKKLQVKLEGLEAESAQTKAALTAAQTKIDEIEERHSVDKQKAVEAAIVEVKAALAVASAAGDHEAIAELTGDLVELSTVEPEPAKPEPKVDPPPVYQPDPSMVSWNEANPWFGTDRRKTALALAIADELREAGEQAINGPFFDLVTIEVDKVFGAPAPIPGKVEGALNGSGGDARVSAAGSSSYASLPTEAKAACMADAKKFVGEGKKYKTDAEWQTRFAEIYNQE